MSEAHLISPMHGGIGDDACHDNTLVIIECIYGRTYRVLQRQLNNPGCIQLALFTKDGRRYSDLPSGHIARHGGTTLHRESIARVVGPHSLKGGVDHGTL